MYFRYYKSEGAADSVALQLEVGSTHTEFEEYKSVTIPIIFPNKNKFDGTLLQGYWAFADGIFSYSPYWVTTDKIPCKPATYYTASASEKITRFQGFVWFDANGDYISQSSEEVVKNIGLTKQSPSNAAYLIFNIAGYPDTQSRITPDEVEQFQIEEGQVATDYEVNGYCYRGTATIDSKGTCEVNNEYKSIILRGYANEDWTNWQISVPNRKMYFHTFQDAKWSGGDSNPNKVYMYTSLYEVKDESFNSACEKSYFCMGVGTSSLRSVIGVNIDEEVAPDVASFRQWLSQNNIQVVYPLEFPAKYTIPAQQIMLLEGGNVVWNDCGDTVLQYFSSGKDTTAQLRATGYILDPNGEVEKENGCITIMYDMPEPTTVLYPAGIIPTTGSVIQKNQAAIVIYKSDGTKVNYVNECTGDSYNRWAQNAENTMNEYSQSWSVASYSKIAFSLDIRYIDDAYMYDKTTGHIWFAGQNTVYYGKENVAD